MGTIIVFTIIVTLESSIRLGSSETDREHDSAAMPATDEFWGVSRSELKTRSDRGGQHA
jgi:hypothetical protein